MLQADSRLLVNLARELAQALGKHPESWNQHWHRCYVPTACGKLELASRVFLNDAPWVAPDGNAVFVLHNEIDHSAGRLLGCTSVRDELARKCKAPIPAEVARMAKASFGQHENLSDRIKGLLREYNDPFDVFIEHWQNSDDAGAESLYFLFDTTSYPTTSLLTERDGCRQLQGPALNLASSKPLSEGDLARIQSVGTSDKSGQFAQAGRFGVGLCCLYHIADCPTLFANGDLIFFDPLHVAVTEAEETGAKYTADLLSENGRFADMLAPFQNAEISKFPTVFRLPLRTKYCAGFERPPVAPADMIAKLEDFATRAQELLIFSKSVQRVTFAVKRDAGVQLLSRFECADPRGAQQLMQSLPTTIGEVKAVRLSPRHVVMPVILTVQLQDSQPAESQWLVSHVIEADESLLAMVESEMESGIALLPHGAAALWLNAPKDYRGQVCCYTPLASMPCGPPLLLHGCFSLSSNRKAVPLASETGASR